MVVAESTESVEDQIIGLRDRAQRIPTSMRDLDGDTSDELQTIHKLLGKALTNEGGPSSDDQSFAHAVLARIIPLHASAQKNNNERWTSYLNSVITTAKEVTDRNRSSSPLIASIYRKITNWLNGL